MRFRTPTSTDDGASSVSDYTRLVIGPSVRPVTAHRVLQRPLTSYQQKKTKGSYQLQMSGYVDEVASWMRSNRLLLNTAKTEVLRCSTSRWHHQIPQTPIRIDDDYVTATASVIWVSISTRTVQNW